jgi:hypothetical protein
LQALKAVLNNSQQNRQSASIAAQVTTQIKNVGNDHSPGSARPPKGV